MNRGVILDDRRRGEMRVEIGKNLKAAAALRGTSNEDLAVMLGISQTRLFRVYTGASELSAAEVAWAIKVLDIAPSILFSGR